MYHTHMTHKLDTQDTDTYATPAKSLQRRACISRSYLDFCMFFIWSFRSLYRTSPLLYRASPANLGLSSSTYLANG